MRQERLLADVVRELYAGKQNGALYVSMVETSEDLFRIYFRNGEIYHIRYGTAVGKDCLDIMEFYTLNSATHFEGILSPGDVSSPDLPPTVEIIAFLRTLGTTVKVR